MSAGLRAGTNNDGYLQVNGTDVLTALSSGRIGIGTSNPSYNLQVSGSLVSNSLGAYTNTNGTIDIRDLAGNPNFNAVEVHIRPAAGKSGYLTFTENTIADRWSIGIANGSGNLRFLNGTISGGSEVFTINSSGNVGIGTNNPDSKLHIFSGYGGVINPDVDADELVLENSGNVGLSLLTASTGESSIYFGNPGTNGQKDGFIKYYHESHATTANRRALVFQGSGTERLRIDGSGNVGIGTISVSAKLDVVGGVGIRVNEDGVGTKAITIRSNWAGVDPAINVTTNHDLLLMTNNLRRVWIKNSGNVGIGTDSANAKLTVNGDILVGSISSTQGDFISSGGGSTATYNGLALLSNAKNLSSQSNNTLSSWIFDLGGRAPDGVTFNTNTNNALTVRYVAAGGSFYSASEHFRITSTGNTGIGITNPYSKLHANGTLTVTNGQFVNYSSSDAGTASDITFTGNGQPVTGHTCAQAKYIRYIPVASLGNQLRIPLVYQGSFNTHTMMRIRGSGARYNLQYHLYFDVSLAVGHLYDIYDLAVYERYGNCSSVTSANGNSTSNPSYVALNFTTAYTNSTVGGLWLWLEYFTPILSYSVKLDSIGLN